MMFLSSTKTIFVAPQKKKKNFPWRISLSIGFVCVLSVLLIELFQSYSHAPAKIVLAANTQQSFHFLPTVTPLPVSDTIISHTIFIAGPTFSPTPIVSASTTPKKSYSIAIIGDSMVDTMGERLEYLEHSLKKKYPLTQFTLYNYGIGGQNVEEGLGRFSSPFHFRDRTYPAIPSVHPDYLIIGSFAYNPFNPYDRNRHWLGLRQLVTQAEAVSSHVYVLAEIAPLLHDFGKGPGGVNWPDPTVHVGHIIDGLKNAEGIAKSEQVGLIDAFAKTEVGGDGTKAYVNSNDNIHPSIAGHEFMANLIANTLQF